MKKIFSVSLALFLLVVTVLPVMAAAEPARIPPRGPFSLVGRISAIDATNGTVTVNVLKGNKLVLPYLNKPLTLKTTATTRYLYKATPTFIAVVITFADLKVGDPVSVNGTLANGVWTATRITVGATLTCFP